MGIEKGLIENDSTVTEEAIRLKKELTRAKRNRNKLQVQINTLDENNNYKFSISSSTYKELQNFFPNANIRHIEEIETFHSKISEVFKKEISDEKEKISKEINEYNNIITELTNQLNNLIDNPNISKSVLQKYADVLKQIERLEAENKAYDTLNNLSVKNKSDKKSLLKVKNEQFGIIEKDINLEMEKINDELYTDKYNSPIIHFTEKSYNFSTPNDTGTGIAYKGLVVFDLAIARLTRLPVLVHDSVVLKQISDNAIENIISDNLIIQ